MKLIIHYIGKSITLLLAVCLMAQSTAQFFVLEFYQWNKNYISKNLCNNRDRPQMKYGGKCYLRKQLKGIDCEKSPCDAPVKKTNVELVAYTLPDKPLLNVLVGVSNNVVARTPVFQRFYTQLFSRSVFHPPRAFSRSV